MKRELHRTLLLLTTASLMLASAAAKGPAQRSVLQKRASVSDFPLVFFQGIDRHLTLLDRDNQKVRASINELQNVRSVARRKRMLRQIQSSKAQRERLRSVNQLLAISARAERRYRNQRQAYGAKLFRDFRTKLSPLKSALIHEQAAQTLSSLAYDQKLFNARLLQVISQYQAVSGGYVALACHPGTWACCQPRTLRDGTATIRGCSWSCASRLTACRGGCLGRRTPNTVVAAKNTPKPPVFAQPAKLAASGKGNMKAKPRLSGPPLRSAATSGR
jgi:hypothetical protein